MKVCFAMAGINLVLGVWNAVCYFVFGGWVGLALIAYFSFAVVGFCTAFGIVCRDQERGARG